MEERLRRLLWLVTSASVLAAIAAPGVGAQAGSVAPISRCADGRAIGLEGLDKPPMSGIVPLPEPVALENLGSTTIGYDFGGERDVDADRYLTFRVPQEVSIRPDDVYVSLPSPLQERDADGKGVFPTKNKQLSYTVQVGRGSFEIHFCLDPERPRAASPGGYQGALLVETIVGVKPASIPMTVDLRDSDDKKVWLIAIVSLLVGLFIKTVADLAKDETTPTSLRGFLAYVNRWSFVWQFVGGAALMVVTVWQVYYTSPDFGGNPDDWTTLVGAIAISVISGISLASFTNLGKTRQIVGSPGGITPSPTPPPTPPTPTPAPDPDEAS